MNVNVPIERGDKAMIMCEDMGTFGDENMKGRLAMSLTGLSLIIDVDHPEKRRYIVSLGGETLQTILGFIAEDMEVTP